jgi:L-erythro-3,5-diaminohexanoate dehydrogenase
MNPGERQAGAAIGANRVLSPPGVLPYAALRLDASTELVEGECLVDVEQLNIDSASWTQLRSAFEDSGSRMSERILQIVRDAGKMHNPVTGSGGMLIGRVSGLGPGRQEPAVGTRICSLISLTCTPLHLDAITALDPDSPQVSVSGHAVLPDAAGWVEVPHDLDDAVFLSAMDVVGAPAWAARLVRPGARVVVIGAGGKAGLLTTAQARARAGEAGAVLGLCWPPATTDDARTAGAHVATAVDCTDPLAVLDAVQDQFGGALADIVFVCANVPGCEGGAILSCHDAGRVLFFSMATSFTAAALIAEAVGRTCELTIGTGYLPQGATQVTTLLRERPELVDLLREDHPADDPPTAPSRPRVIE